MPRTLARAEREARYIWDRAPYLGMRTGQLLFNDLRHEIADVVRDTDMDPFYVDLDLDELIGWFEDHIEFDNQGRMVRLFSGNDVLWEDNRRAA